IERLGCTRGSLHSKLAIARVGNPLSQLGQDGLIDMVAALFRFTHRPDDQAGMMAGRTLVLAFPRHRVSGQKGEAASDRATDFRRLLMAIRFNCGSREYSQSDQHGRRHDGRSATVRAGTAIESPQMASIRAFTFSLPGWSAPANDAKSCSLIAFQSHF